MSAAHWFRHQKKACGSSQLCCRVCHALESDGTSPRVGTLVESTDLAFTATNEVLRAEGALKCDAVNTSAAVCGRLCCHFCWMDADSHSPKSRLTTPPLHVLAQASAKSPSISTRPAASSPPPSASTTTSALPKVARKALVSVGFSTARTCSASPRRLQVYSPIWKSSSAQSHWRAIRKPRSPMLVEITCVPSSLQTSSMRCLGSGLGRFASRSELTRCVLISDTSQ